MALGRLRRLPAERLRGPARAPAGTLGRAQGGDRPGLVSSEREKRREEKGRRFSFFLCFLLLLFFSGAQLFLFSWKRKKKNSPHPSFFPSFLPTSRCPRCEDVFVPRSRAHAALDGAYFGTTCPHLLLLTYPGARPPPPDPAARYVPRVFGFRLHASATARGPAGGAGGSAAPAVVSTVAGGPTISNNNNNNNSNCGRRGGSGAALPASAGAAGTSAGAAALAPPPPSSSAAAAATATAMSGLQEMKDADRR